MGGSSACAMGAGVARDAEFVAFVCTHRRALHRWAYLTSGDWHLAEDLVQTALVKLYDAWPRISCKASVEAYVRRILMRTHIDHQRQQQRRPETPTAEVPDRRLLVDNRPDGEPLLEAAVAALPEGQRQVVFLRYFADMSVAQTAAVLGCSQGNVKSQASRAIVRLRDTLCPPPTGLPDPDDGVAALKECSRRLAGSE